MILISKNMTRRLLSSILRNKNHHNVTRQPLSVVFYHHHCKLSSLAYYAAMFSSLNSYSTNSRFKSPYSSRVMTTTSSSIPQSSTIVELNDRQYHQCADELMDTLVDYFEELGEEIDLKDYDILYSSGVLTLSLGSHGTYVINKQPPNKQIWLSSPKSGPKRFDYFGHGNWIYARENVVLIQLLNEELSSVLNRQIEIS